MTLHQQVLVKYDQAIAEAENELAFIECALYLNRERPNYQVNISVEDAIKLGEPF